MDAAQIVGADGLPLWAIAGQHLQQRGDGEAGPMPLDQCGQCVLSGLSATAAGKDQDRDTSGDIGQGQGTAGHQ
jgi:hypothetical protein